jgi:hypothetical protein
MCKKGYHVNCFAVYHCAGALTVEAKVLSEMHMKAEKLPRASNCGIKCVGTISDLELPVLTEKINYPGVRIKVWYLVEIHKSMIRYYTSLVYYRTCSVVVSEFHHIGYILFEKIGP